MDSYNKLVVFSWLRKDLFSVVVNGDGYDYGADKQVVSFTYRNINLSFLPVRLETPLSIT